MIPTQAVDRAEKPAVRTAVYVANAASSEILAFALEADGVLEPVGRLHLGATVAPLTLAPGRCTLYAALRDDPAAIATLAVDSKSGRLTTIATTPIAHRLAYLHLDRSGRYLMGASYTDGLFGIYALNGDGRVAPTYATETPPHAHCVMTDPSNRYVFVTSLGGDVILQFTFDAERGRAIPNDPPFITTPKGSGPRHMVFHPQADIAYVNHELDGSIGVYAFDPKTGRLREVGRTLTMPDGDAGAPWSADMHVTPDGRFLYASERRSSTLACFAVDERGRLERRALLPTESQPRSFAIDPSGRYLFVAGERSQHLTTYTVDAATGGLRACGRSALGEKPVWVSVALPGAAR